MNLNSVSFDDFVDVVQTITKKLRRLPRRYRLKKNRKNIRKWSEYKPPYQYQQRKYVSMKYKMNEQERKHENNYIDSEIQHNPPTPEYYLAGSSLNDHYITKMVNERTKNKLHTHSVKETIVCTPSQWTDFIRTNYHDLQVIEFGETAGMIIDNEEIAFIDYSVNSTSVDIRIYGASDYIQKQRNVLVESFIIAPCYIEWVYSNDGSSVSIPLLNEKLPITEMYPFLGDETIEEYYDRYLDSSAAILLLIGPPGTGKTTFIRGLLHHSSQNAMVTYDETILQKDYVFARFLEEEVNVMVIEDADNFLKPRADGNSMMHRFLNVGDGLITIRGKKLIFSTNLPSLKNIDTALTRPGRCFDIITFDNYTDTQAAQLAKKMKIDFKPEKGKKYSLAEIFYKQRNSKTPQPPKMGFI